MLPLALGAVLSAVLLAQRGRRPRFVPKRVTDSVSFRIGTWVATTSNWGSGVVLVLVPAAIQAVRHTSVLETGVLFLAFSIPYALGGAVSGLMARSFGGRASMGIGTALLAVGLGGLAIVGPGGPGGALVLTLAIAGAGNGVLYSVSTSFALTDTAPADAGEGSALLTMLRLLGLTLSVALSTSLMLRVDGFDLGFESAGLRVALGLAAVVVAAGAVPLVARAKPDPATKGVGVPD